MAAIRVVLYLFTILLCLSWCSSVEHDDDFAEFAEFDEEGQSNFAIRFYL